MTGSESHLQVSGGVGGVEARYLDLDALAEHTRGVAEEFLGMTWADAGKVVDGDLIASAVLSPGTALAAERDILLATASFGAAALRLEVLAVGVQASRLLDQACDQAIEQTIYGFSYGIGYTAPASPGPLLGLGMASALLGNETLMDGAYDGLRASAQGQFLASLLSRRARGEARVKNTSDISLPAPQSVADLTRAVNEASGESGRFTVQELVGADGKSRWIVQLPGTDFNDFSSVRNIGANLQLMDGGRTAYGDAVEDALATAGVGKNDPVLLTGHSQGGMQAMALGDDPDFGYNVQGVLTLGSPVSGVDLGPDVAVLNVENSDDLVPMLDGGHNGAGPAQVTVSADVDDTSLLENHSLEDSYIPLSDRIDRSEDKSLNHVLTDWRAEGFLGEVAATNTTTFIAEFADRR